MLKLRGSVGTSNDQNIDNTCIFQPLQNVGDDGTISDGKKGFGGGIVVIVLNQTLDAIQINNQCIDNV